MSLLQSLLLGLLQGATEFLPVSSSGHLALAELFFGLRIAPRDLQAFDIVLHAGSLIALLFFYRAVWRRLLLSPFRGDLRGLRLLFLLILATIPAVVAGFLLEELLAEHFRSLLSLAIQLVVTGILLFVAESFRGEKRMDTLGSMGALSVGIAQAVALIPAISRSGMTMASGRMMGLSRKDAIDFSFLMAVPVLAGAVLLTLTEVLSGTVDLPPLSHTLMGFVASLVASIIAIGFLRSLAAVVKLRWFSLYLFVLAAVLLWYHFDISHLWTHAQMRLLVESYGALTVFLFALVEAIPPLCFVSPGVLGLVVAGSLAADIPTAVHFALASLAGIVLGNMILYLLGRTYGRGIGHRFSLTEARLRSLDRFTARFGTLSVFVGQFVGTVRPFVSFIMGTAHLSRSHFYSAMLIGSTIFCTLFIGLGFVARTELDWILSIVGSGGVLILLVAAFIVWSIRRVRERRRCKSTSHPSSS